MGAVRMMRKGKRVTRRHALALGAVAAAGTLAGGCSVGTRVAALTANVLRVSLSVYVVGGGGGAAHCLACPRF